MWRDCVINPSAQRSKVKYSEENSELVLSFLPGRRVLTHTYSSSVFFLLLINVPKDVLLLIKMQFTEGTHETIPSEL